MHVEEIADKKDIAMSTAYRHVESLRCIGYLRHDEDDRYSIGYQFLELGDHARNQNRLYQVSKSKINQLVKQTDERAQLFVEEHGLGSRIYGESGQQGVDTDTIGGQHTYLHTNAAGKAILAYLPEQRREEIYERWGLPKQTENTLTNRQELESHLAEIRERQYSFNKGERIQGLYAVGVPILTQDQSVLGSISISGPSGRFTGEWLQEELPSIIQGAANEIELNLQYD
jgi:DNA-binding IclR family transcriptional regulator